MLTLIKEVQGAVVENSFAALDAAGEPVMVADKASLSPMLRTELPKRTHKAQEPRRSSSVG